MSPCSAKGNVRSLKASRALLFVPLFSVFMVFLFTPTIANACCWACPQSDCDDADQFIQDAHTDIEDRVKSEFDFDLDEFEQWMEAVMFDTQFIPAMAAMANQMTAVAMEYTSIIGSFLDAQNQLDAQRLFRKLQFDAHKDYRPSDDYCYFGTNVRSLAGTESKGRINSLSLSEASLVRQLGNINVAGSKTPEDDYKARWDQFVKTYCDQRSNNNHKRYLPYTSTLTGYGLLDVPGGLDFACDHDGVTGGGTTLGADNYNRTNRDIDYTRLIEEPRTLDLDFVDTTLDSDIVNIITLASTVGKEPGDEEDVIALSKNLYGHKVLSRDISQATMKSSTARKLYLALRSVAAKRGVAQASFNAIVGLKSSGTSHEDPLVPIAYPSGAAPVPPVRATTSTRRYMASIMRQLLPSDPSSGLLEGGNIFDLIGYSPSYYSQLEVLAKRIYQNPDFYADLYDTPANVARKKVAMKAIELMVDRAIYESQLRREMSVSVLLSTKLGTLHKVVNQSLDVSKPLEY